MINEKDLEKYYAELAKKADEMIPCEWVKLAMRGEVTENTSTVGFWFYTEDGKHHWSANIWDEYGVDEKMHDNQSLALFDVAQNLWMEFKNAGEEPWSSFTFLLDKDWKFSMKYAYEQEKGLNVMESNIRWAYEELGIIPKGTYGKKLLKKYLQKKEIELPEELKEI